MIERDLEAELRATPVPAGSRERAARGILAALPEARGRPWRLPLAGLVALIAGFAFTAPGQATVEWVAETIHLQDPEGGGFRETDGKIVGSGMSPSGHRYEVLAYPAGGGGVCLQLEPPVEEVETKARSFSESTCVFRGDSEAMGIGGGPAELDGQPSYLPLTSGGVIALGGVDDAVRSVEVGADDAAPIDADLFPVAGEVAQPDGSVEHLPNFNAYVVFLPPGIGEVQGGIPAEFTAHSSDDDVILGGELAWAAFGEGASASAVNCAAGAAESQLGQVCEDARAGELNHVDARLARPLPPELADLLARNGYSYVPASDDDRELAADPEFDFAPRSKLALSAFTGIAYEIYAGRVSGGGLPDRLVYVLRDFPAMELPDKGAGAGLQLEDGRDRPALGGTFIVDAITGETLDQLGGR